MIHYLVHRLAVLHGTAQTGIILSLIMAFFMVAAIWLPWFVVEKASEHAKARKIRRAAKRCLAILLLVLVGCTAFELLVPSMHEVAPPHCPKAGK